MKVRCMTGRVKKYFLVVPALVKTLRDVIMIDPTINLRPVLAGQQTERPVNFTEISTLSIMGSSFNHEQ